MRNKNLNWLENIGKILTKEGIFHKIALEIFSGVNYGQNNVS